MEILDSLPKGVEFIPIDLEKQTIADGLSDSSYSKDEKAFFSWLGTVPYLSEEAVFNLLHHLASFAVHGSEIVFDYLIPTYLMTPQERRALGRVMRIIERWGEPVHSFFEPDTFPDRVSRLGYHIFENQSPAEQNNKYFFERSDNLKTHSAAYNIHAAISKF